MRQVNQVILGGNTPLLNAAWRGFVPIVQLLLQHGADINATDNTQENALHKAASTGSSQVKSHPNNIARRRWTSNRNFAHVGKPETKSFCLCC